MTSARRRALAFAAVGALAVPVIVGSAMLPPPALPFASAAPFLAIAGLALFVLDDGPLYELFARPGDRRDRRLYGLAGFSLAIGGLSLLVTRLDMPLPAFLSAVLVVSFGPAVARFVDGRSGGAAVRTAAFVAGGASAAVIGTWVTIQFVTVSGSTFAAADISGAALLFVATTGGLVAALLRVTLVDRDDPLVMVSVAVVLWVLVALPVAEDLRIVTAAIVGSGLLGVIARRLQTASVHGMVSGVLLALWAIVLGNGQPGWVLLLVTFFGVGGLSTKFRYEQKRDRDIAEAEEGARGSGNVFANAAVATVALVGAAGSPTLTGVSLDPFLFAFAGSLAAALGDTLSSEIGGLYDRPRLITTFEVVDPGTDGAVTWQGESAGLLGASVIAAIAVLSFEAIGLVGAGVIVGAGLVGMTTDSLLGATVEGVILENQGVNFVSTAVAGLVAGAIVLL